MGGCNLMPTIVQAVGSGADAATTSKNVTLTQPASGNKCVVIGGAWTAFPGQPDVANPAGITERAHNQVSGNLGVVAGDKVATGSGETSFGITCNSAALCVYGINLSNAGTLTTKGTANSGGTAQDGLTITAENPVAVDGSLALALFVRRGALNGGDTSYTATGWTEVAKVWQGTSPADEAESVLLSKVVNISDGTVSCVVSDTASDSNHAGIILIYPPSNATPTITDPGDKRLLRGGDTVEGIVFTDADGTDLTVDIACSNGTLSMGDSGTLEVTGSGTANLQLVGTPTELNAVIDTLTYTSNVNTADTITVDAGDGVATATQVSIGVTKIVGRITGDNLTDINSVMSQLILNEPSAKTVVVTVYTVDSGGRTDTAQFTVEVGAPVAGGNTLIFTRRKKR